VNKRNPPQSLYQLPELFIPGTAKFLEEGQVNSGSMDIYHGNTLSPGREENPGIAMTRRIFGLPKADPDRRCQVGIRRIFYLLLPLRLIPNLD
jgi:hypothetical protein